MERTAHVAGYSLSLQKTERGYQFEIEADPNRQSARQEIYQMVDQLRDAAKNAGVSSPEMAAHWVRGQIGKFNPLKKRGG